MINKFSNWLSERKRLSRATLIVAMLVICFGYFLEAKLASELFRLLDKIASKAFLGSIVYVLLGTTVCLFYGILKTYYTLFLLNPRILRKIRELIVLFYAVMTFITPFILFKYFSELYDIRSSVSITFLLNFIVLILSTEKYIKDRNIP